jgi:hypothetical protein
MNETSRGCVFGCSETTSTQYARHFSGEKKQLRLLFFGAKTVCPSRGTPVLTREHFLHNIFCPRNRFRFCLAQTRPRISVHNCTMALSFHYFTLSTKMASFDVLGHQTEFYPRDVCDSPSKAPFFFLLSLIRQ